MKTRLAAMIAAGMVGTAMGQITIVSVNGLARATAGDGSGTNQQVSSNTSSFNLSAVKNFQNHGRADADNTWGFASGIMSGSFAGHSYAASQGEAGSGEVETTVFFNLAMDYDIEWGGGYSMNSPSGFIDLAIRNRVNNNYVAGGNSPNLVHVPSGQYKLVLDGYLPYGEMSGGYTAKFRPGNDRCEYAWQIGNGVYVGSTEMATFDGQATCGTSNFSRSVWYKYTAIKTAPLKITTCGSSYDTVLSVYETDTCPSGTGSQVACNDDSAECGARSSAVTVNAIEGETYYIRVSGYDGAFGDFQLNVGPVNDHCTNAQEVSFGTTPFDNRLATTEGPTLSECTNNGQDNQVNGDLWYVFTPAFNGSMSIDTCGSTFDTKIALYINAPCVGHSTYVACSDDSCNLQSAIQNQPMVAGYHYYIRVGGYRANRGTGELHINVIPNPPCPADFNGDGFLDFFDYDDFVNCFETGTCPPGRDADVNGDDFVDFFDYDTYVQMFEAGC